MFSADLKQYTQSKRHVSWSKKVGAENSPSKQNNSVRASRRPQMLLMPLDLPADLLSRCAHTSHWATLLCKMVFPLKHPALLLCRASDPAEIISSSRDKDGLIYCCLYKFCLKLILFFIWYIHVIFHNLRQTLHSFVITISQYMTDIDDKGSLVY